MGLQNRQHQGPCREAQALVTHTAQLAMAIVAIGLLDGRIVQRYLSVVLCQGLSHGPMAVVRSRRFGLLRRGGRRDCVKGVRTAFRDGHPCAGPQAQGHQAKQEAKEQATHSQIICQAGQCSGSEVRMTVQALRSRHVLLDVLMRGRWGSRLGADEKEHGPRVKPGVTNLEARSPG